MQKRMWRLVVFLWCLFISCSLFIPGPKLGEYYYTHRTFHPQETQILPVYIDANLGEGYKVEVGKALDRWNYVFNGRAKFVVVNDHFQMEDDQLKKAVSENAFLILSITSANPI